MGSKMNPKNNPVAAVTDIRDIRKSSRPQVGLINDSDGASVKKGGSRLLTFKIVGIIIVTCLIAMAVVISAVLLSRDTAYPVPTSVLPAAEDPQPNYTDLPSSDDQISIPLSFASRAEWAARPPVKPLLKLPLPVRYVIISETETFSCETQKTCTFRVQFTQAIDVESENLSDIRYNFLIGGDNLTYVGRDWDYVGAHSYGYNFKSIGIAFIGTFNDVPPSEYQIVVAKELIELGVKLGKISPNYKLLGYRQVSRNRNPGTALYEIIKKLPHWSPKL